VVCRLKTVVEQDSIKSLHENRDGKCRGGACPGHLISWYGCGSKWSILCWCATATRSRPPHWLYVQVPTLMRTDRYSLAMVVVDASCLKQADSQPNSCGLVWGSAAAWRCSTFTRWTEWTLAMTWSWWQHYEYRRGYYYYYLEQKPTISSSDWAIEILLPRSFIINIIVIRV